MLEVELTSQRDRMATRSGRNVVSIYNVHRESKKGATLTMAITLSIVDGFAKFYQCCKEQ